MRGSPEPRVRDANVDDGVDVTLIRWMLSLSPRKRLDVLQSNVRSLRQLRDAKFRA
jgi:hypothetical protein